ncbi:MAG TPA: MMPL family transporter [Opitutaceae bacterium]|nr:MMPL family transporter [Opitutaceae bacterium]
MEPARQKLFARCALAAFVVLCAGWLARLDYTRKISTNVLDLIPPDEQSPEVAVARSLAGDLQVRVMLFALHDPAAPTVSPEPAARLFADELARSPALAEVVTLGDTTAQTEMGRHIFERRFALLLPAWLGERQREFAQTGQPAQKFSSWLAERAAADLESFLSKPEAVPMQDLVLKDPLLLTPHLIERAGSLGLPGAHADGHALIWARIKASPLTEEGQQPVFAAVEQALAKTRAHYPSVEVQWSGINRFAAASRARIEWEIKILNTASILAVLAVGCVFVRRIWKMLHLLPVIVCSLLGAWTASTLLFPRLHVLVFVIGSLLSGVAIDYGFYIYMQPSRRPGEPYADKLGRLLKPLLASCLTTVIGFSLLLFSNLPFIRQVGLFVSAGLLCALAGAMLYFAQLEQPFLEGRQFGRLSASKSPWQRLLPRLMFITAIAIALAGPWRLHWQDDIRELDIPAPQLIANEQALRTLFGDTSDNSVYLTYGNSVAEARRHLENFLAYESKTAPGVAPASFGLVFPTEEDWQALPARLNNLDGFADDFRAALDRHGFVPASFDSFFDDWANLRKNPPAGAYADLYADIGRIITGPLAQLYNSHGPLYWFLTIIKQPDAPLPPAGLFTVSADQLQSLNHLFTRYRWSALRLSLVGLALVIISVFVIYPFRAGLRIALIPAGSCFFIFGVFGFLGQTLNLFHLLGAFLGLCLAHNYAIFSSESAHGGTPPPVAIRLSALSAASSFGVLSFSRIPVVHSLGLTVALIVLTALTAVELEPLARGDSNSPESCRPR